MRWRRRAGLLLLGGLGLFSCLTSTAEAHGPVAPVATSFLARLSSVPAGLEAKVVDGYVRLWLRVPTGQTVVVLDYRGAPYLRFSRAGVQVNENSTMYYLNETPVAQTPPSDLNRSTPPKWRTVSGGPAYEWHDGRLQGLAQTALAHGVRYVGRWSIPILVDGRSQAIQGTLWHADDPSLVWFWPLVVMLGCVLAARRLALTRLDRQLVKLLCLLALLAIAAAAAAQQLHGRPDVSASQYAELTIFWVFCAWGTTRVALGRSGTALHYVIAFVALWQGLDLVSTLLKGFVLLPMAPFLVRTTALLCLGPAVSILLLVTRAPKTRTSREEGNSAKGLGRLRLEAPQ